MATGESIGFIGVGLMGHGMAKCLVEKGYPLTVIGRRNRAPIEDLKARGAKEVATPAELANRASIIFLCVTGAGDVAEVVRGPTGIASTAKPGTVIIDCTTSDPAVTIALAGELDAKGIKLVDAPLGGTPAQAAAGQLSAMVGADAETFARIEPVIAAWAARVTHIGAVGDGHKMKLLNNFLSMGYAAIYAEALTLAHRMGISPQRFDSVLRGSRMDCGFYQTFFKYVLERDRDAHKFTLANAYKDVRYLSQMADSVQMPNPVGAAVKNVLGLAVGLGHAEKFVPMLSDIVAGLQGIDLTEPPPAT
jgi:hypothetical protein